MNYEYEMDYLKKYFVKKKIITQVFPFYFFWFHSCSISPKAEHMVALKLLTDKRERMLFYPFKVFPNSVTYNRYISTSTFLVIKKCK